MMMCRFNSPEICNEARKRCIRIEIGVFNFTEIVLIIVNTSTDMYYAIKYYINCENNQVYERARCNDGIFAALCNILAYSSFPLCVQSIFPPYHTHTHTHQSGNYFIIN